MTRGTLTTADYFEIEHEGNAQIGNGYKEISVSETRYSFSIQKVKETDVRFIYIDEIWV